MPALIPVKRPWTRQPSAYVPIDWSNPINRDLVWGYWAPYTRNRVAGEMALEKPPIAVGELGVAPLTASGAETDEIHFPESQELHTLGSSYTLILIIDKTGHEGTAGFFCQRNSSTSGFWEWYNTGTQWRMMVRDSVLGNRTADYGAGLSFSNGMLRCALRNEGSGNSTMFQRAGNAMPTLSVTETGQNIDVIDEGTHAPTIGALQVDLAGHHTFGYQYCALAYKRELSTREIDSLFENEWQGLEPRISWMPVVVDLSGELISEDNDLTFTRNLVRPLVG